jgi:hypothetical protein
MKHLDYDDLRSRTILLLTLPTMLLAIVLSFTVSSILYQFANDTRLSLAVGLFVGVGFLVYANLRQRGSMRR